MFRLVRDEDTDWTEMAEQDPNDEADSPGAKSSAAAADRATASESAEPQDGAVAEDGDDSTALVDDSVNVAALEAMLMSTHHPLTAGRLAELLDLSSTK